MEKMMSDQERVQILLSQTVMLLCKNGLRFEKELRVQGLLGITIDHENVFIVHFNESLANTAAGNYNEVAAFSAQGSGNAVENVTSDAPFAETSVGKASRTDEAAKPRSPNTINHSQELAIDRNEQMLHDDVTQVKVEPNSDTESSPVVLVESDAEQDTVTSRFIATGHETGSQKWRLNVRKKFHPTVQSCSKRRPPSSINSMSAYDSSSSVVKLEPASLQCPGTDEQNFGYSDSFSEQNWDSAESIFCRTDQTISPERSPWQPGETRSSESDLYASAMSHESLPLKTHAKGRRHDSVWRYFSKINAKSSYGRTIFRAKCKVCGKIQSNIAQRLRQHIAMFHELDLPAYETGV